VKEKDKLIYRWKKRNKNEEWWNKC